MSMPPPLPSAPGGHGTVPPAPARMGWWQRHWRWAVPMLALVSLALAGAFVYGLVSVVSGAMRDNDAYRIAMAQAAADPRLAAAIGTPIEHDGFMSGRLSTGATSRASLQIPVSGPRGEATVFVEAEARLGVWRFAVLSATVDGADAPFDLLPSLPESRRMRPGERDAYNSANDDAEALD